MNRRALLRVTAGGCLLSLAGLLPSAPALAQGRPAAAGTGSVPDRKPRAPRLVMLDPGHGGRDPGAIGARGTYEKDVTLDIAKEMARLLRRERGVDAALTRDGDATLGLAERVTLAREARADLFISIHADSAPNPRARGLSAYTLSEKASDEFAAAIAQQENLADALGVGGGGLDPAVQAFLVDLAADRTRKGALEAKQRLVKGAGRDLTLLDNPMRYANFAVLRAPDVPSVLVETGFLSNKEDERLLRDPAARRRIAGVLARELAAVMNSAMFA